MNKITVLDYTTSTTWIFKIDESDCNDVETKLQELGFKISNCCWMIGKYINIDI